MNISAFTKSYDGHTVLDMRNFSLQDGKITVVIGANGSGKSSLARVLSGIERTDQNKTLLTGVSIGFMPQKSYAFRMSTLRNIMLNGKNTKHAVKLMKELQLESLSRRQAKNLSGGETEKMALCRLLMGRYDVLILDEPTAAMDMQSTLAAEKLIVDCCRETCCTTLLITHSIQQAHRIADYILYLQEGRLLEQGNAEQILSQPKEKGTKQFLDFYGIRISE